MTLTSTEIFLYGSGLSAFWALVGWIANHWLSAARDKRNRIYSAKDTFLSVIAAHRAKLDTTAKYNEQEFFEASLEPIGSAVYAVKIFLSDREWMKLEQVWKEYSEQSKSDYGGGMARVYMAMIGASSHQARLISFLERFQQIMQ